MSIRTTALLSLLAVSWLCSCRTATLNSPTDADPISQFLEKNLEIESNSPFVTKEPIILDSVSFSAVCVDVRDQTPAYTLVLVETAHGVVAPLVNKTLTRDWKEAVTAALSAADGAFDDPALLAKDLTKLLVDPDPSYAKVISVRSDIPVDIRLSDRLRDLERMELPQRQIRETLLEPLGDSSQLRSPQFVEREGRSFLEFFTWGFFGGEVLKWQIALSDTNSYSSVQQIASLVGSYDFYM